MTKQSINVRAMTDNDLPALHAILKHTPSDWAITTIRDCFNEYYLNAIIALNQKIVGFIIVKNNIYHWEIMQLVVDSDYQKQGLATALLQYVIKQAQQHHIETIQLEVRSCNFPAIALYQKCGFKTAGLRKNYYPDDEDAILMDMTLS